MKFFMHFVVYPLSTLFVLVFIVFLYGNLFVILYNSVRLF